MTKPTFTTSSQPKPPKPDRPASQWKPWHKWTIGICVGLIVFVTLIAALAPTPEDDASAVADAKPAAAKNKEPAKSRTFKQYLDDGGVDDIKSAKCFETRACEITISSNAGSKDGLIMDTFKAQQVAWDKKPKPREVLVEVETDLVSVGGKERRGIALGVLCSREAANEIVWDNVLAEGVEQLCIVSPRVDLE